MDFVFDQSHPGQYLYEVKLLETRTKEVFYDKLAFIYLEVPKFDKGESELRSHLDKWVYLLKNLNKLEDIPSILQERIFKKLFAIAEVSNLNAEEMRTYEASLKDKRDLKNVMDYAVEEAKKAGRIEGRKEGQIEGRKEGRIEGRKEEKINLARLMKQENEPVDRIIKYTGLSIDEINRL